jgi:hypothetical protein
MLRNARPEWIGTGGRFESEWMAGLGRNTQLITGHTADKRLRQPVTISLDEDKAKVRIATSNNSLKRQVALLRAMQEMREEMDRVWKDFFEKNPDKNEEDVRRRVEKRLRSEGSAQGCLRLRSNKSIKF